MPERPPHRRLVLLLEDEALIAITLQADLEEAGYAVAGPFVTCAAALEWLREHRPDLAILDTMLKDGPCRDVALKLAEISVPCLVYSAQLEEVDTVTGLSRATWIEKPAPAEALLRALEDLTPPMAALS